MSESTLKRKDVKNGGEKNGMWKVAVVRNIQPTRNWCEWIGFWESTLNLQWKESLLHEGFKVSLRPRELEERKYDEIDRLAFYFAIADGWTDDSLLRFPEDEGREYRIGYDSCGNVITKTPSELRQGLARKAFDMLCLNFFKMELLVRGRHGDEFREERERIITSERFFPVIQNFFRVQEAQFRDRVEIRNFPRRRDEKRSHNEQLTVDFLINLAKFLWGWREPDDEYYYSGEDKKRERREYLAATRSRIDSAKPWMVKVLSNLDRLDVLREWILEIDKACLAKLKEIAMSNEFGGYYPSPVRKKRPVATLDEACYLSSKAAWFLKEHELKMREHKRLTAIREAEQTKEEASRQIEKLAAVK